VGVVADGIGVAAPVIATGSWLGFTALVAGIEAVAGAAATTALALPTP